LSGVERFDSNPLWVDLLEKLRFAGFVVSIADGNNAQGLFLERRGYPDFQIATTTAEKPRQLLARLRHDGFIMHLNEDDY
jgi:hypothetical protein